MRLGEFLGARLCAMCSRMRVRRQPTGNELQHGLHHVEGPADFLHRGIGGSRLAKTDGVRGQWLYLIALLKERRIVIRAELEQGA